jgi:HlyD family type I secretion membrane fusion protein
VRQVLVREGQHVQDGQVLFRLDHTQPQASADISRNQLMSALAQEARLVAERDRLPAIVFPPELLAADAGPTAAESIKDQINQFDERRASFNNQVSIIEKKITQYSVELEGLASERASTERQLKFIEEELRDLRGLLDKQLVPKSRVMSLEREKGRLEGMIGRSIAETSKAHNGISESRLQIDQLRKKLAEEVNNGLLEVRQKIADLRERTRVSKDVLHRIDIRAPRAGVVQNVKASTVGGVVRPGEPLLELIPDGDELIVNAQVAPSDIDIVAPGNEAEVRFAAFHGKVLPILTGRITSLSRDRLTDEATRMPYFLARVVVNTEPLPAEVRDRIVAGMPVEVIIPTGERTMFDYLVRPLGMRMRKALREQ